MSTKGIRDADQGSEKVRGWGGLAVALVLGAFPTAGKPAAEPVAEAVEDFTVHTSPPGFHAIESRKPYRSRRPGQRRRRG